MVASNDRNNDKLTVFHNNADGIDSVKEVSVQDASGYRFGGNYGFGTGIYSADFELVRTLPIDNFVTSRQTGPYYATLNNEIYRYSDHKLIMKYADTKFSNYHWLFPVVFFPKAESDEIYIWSGQADEAGPMPSVKLYTLPFEKN